MTLASAVRGAGRIGAVVTTVLLLSTGPLPAAAAAPGAPLGQYADILTFEVDSITPTLLSGTAAVLTITGTMTNTAEETLHSVAGRIQRGDVLATPAELAAEIADPGQPAASWTDFTALGGDIPAQATVPFQITATMLGDDGLGITDPGVYPVMLNVNAEFDSGPSSGARVGELHALATVAGVPAPDGATAPAATQGIAQPLNVLIPLVDRPHRDPTGAFFDDDLAPLISTGGRLETALRAAETSTLTESAITVAVDPELIEELQLMRDGYFVGPFAVDLPTAAAAATVTATAVPTGDSTAATQPLPGPTAVPGTGSAAAADFLRRLTALAQRTSVLALPYADADTVAMVRNGRAAEVATAIQTGRQIAVDALGRSARLVNVAWPIDGQIDDATLDVFRQAGLASAVLAGTTVADPSMSVATVATADGPVTGVIAVADLPAGALALNTFTAVTAQNYFGAVSRPAVYAGSRARAATDDYPELTAALAALNQAGMVTGAALSTMTSDGTTTALAYPEAARAAELGPAVFAGISAGTAAVQSLQSAFIAPTTPDAGGTGNVAPTNLFATMLDGMRRMVAGGFRTQPAAAATAAAAVPATISAVQSAVAIVPPTGTYTLTSTSSPIVVVIRNDLAYDVHLRVRVNPLDATRAGIKVEDVGVLTVPAGRSVTAQVPAQINRAGFFTVRVQLTTADGVLWGQEQSLQMRSTAYGAFTITLIVVAAVIVVITSAFRIRKRYRDRRQRIEAGLQ